MNNFIKALKNIPRRGQHNFVKILCLGVGFALSSVLIAKLCFESEYDTCYPDHDRIYRVSEKVQRGSDPEAIYGRTPGGVAPLLKKHFAQIETATRINPLCTDEEMKIDTERRVKGNVYIVDSCFFKVFTTKILEGDADETLAKPFYCLVSRTMAERMGGEVVGRKLECTTIPGLVMTVGAVYEDYPWNSTFHDYDVMLSMATQRSFSYDGQDNLMGNDRYRSFIKVSPGCHPELGEFDATVKQLVDKLMAELKKNNIDYALKFTPVSKYHYENSDSKQMYLVMLILAAVVLAASVLNYLLIVMGNTVTRAKEMAVRKCYGAMPRSIFGITVAETSVHIVLSLVLAAALIYVCKGSIETLLDAPATALFTNKGVLFLAALLVVVFIINAILPGKMYNAVPVTTAFRGFTENRRRWKMALLAVQFVFVSFLVCLLLVVNRQYATLLDFNLGYEYDRLALVNINQIKGEERRAMVAELGKMTEVEAWTPVTYPMFDQGSGNNIVDPETREELFNAHDLYMTGDNFFSLTGVKILQGRGFNAHSDSLREVMVSPDFAQKLKNAKGWNDVIGRKIVISEHSQDYNDLFTIVGIYDKYRPNTALDDDDRPTMMFYSDPYGGYISYLLVKFHDLTADNMQAVQRRLARLYPGKTVIVDSYKRQLDTWYDGVKNFRSAVIIAGLCALLIALLGLIGYINDEMQRRSKEIAIRKVNGASTVSVLRLMLRGVLVAAVPASIVGAAAAGWVAGKWLEDFSVKAGMSLWLFIAGIIIVLAVIAATVIADAYRTANGNPAKYLKDE